MSRNRRIEKNGYILVNEQDHPRAFSATGEDVLYVYEHILVAEDMMNRSLLSTEVVHHLDENRSNNSPDNLLVLPGPMHNKLHSWMNKHHIVPTPEHQKRIIRGCVRCKVCDFPIDHNLIYCSEVCSRDGSRKVLRPDAKTLMNEILNSSFLAVGRKYGVSDNSVRKWCKQEQLPTKKRELEKLK